MRLTDATLRAAKSNGKATKLRDGNGLYVHVLPSGRYFRYDYRYGGKRKTLTIGAFPAVTLKAARIALHEAKALLDQGIDPNVQKKVARYVNTDHSFEVVAKEWLAQHDCTERSREDIRQRFEKDAYPIIGGIPVERIKPTDVLAVVRRIESRDALDLAGRVRTHISQAMRYAIYCGLVDIDPCRDLKGAIKRKKNTKRYPAITDREGFGKLLIDIDKYGLNMVIGLCLRLAPHVALRPTELRAAPWNEIDFDSRLWSIPMERMKKDRPHFVPLSDQALKIILQLRDITWGSEHMFPSPVKPKQPISESTLTMALNRLGYGGKHCPHGFRSSFSTMANESGKFDPDAIEAQLSHMDADRVRAAYNRADHAEQRAKLMQWWSDEVDTMRSASRT